MNFDLTYAREHTMEPLNFKSISNEEIPIQHYAVREQSSERKTDEYISKKKRGKKIIEKWNVCMCATRQCGYGSYEWCERE